MAAYAALISLFNNIHHIKNHTQLSTSFDDHQIEILRENVSFFIDYVESYNCHRGSKEEAEQLESRIASAVHEAEDVIESHVVDRIEARSCRNTHRRLFQLQKVIADMDSIKEKVTEFKENWGFEEEQHPVPVIPSTPFSTGNATMVGFDVELIQLMDVLTGQQSDREIISMVGMGGIGKTTLARNIYENLLIVQHFDVRAWTTISQEYSVRKCLLELLSCLGIFPSGPVYELDDSLGEYLYKSLCGRRYLIFLDDMWSIEFWDKIKFFFPDNGHGSRVVLTTRLSNVATHCSSSSSFFKMNFLDENKSWKLFCEKVFGNEDCPPELEGYGKQIARLCKGLPLSITVIGGLLQKSQRSGRYWYDVATNINSILNSGENEQCFNILSLSYSHLPAHLKPCFLYTGVFKEDYDIGVSEIIKLWVAEGFLKPNGGQILEEIAECYLKDLIDRNLILVSGYRKNGNIKTCRVHDLLRDLCIRVAEKEKFFRVVRVHSIPRGIERERRLICHDMVNVPTTQVINALESASLARVVICENHVKQLSKYKLLRVWNTGEGCPANNFNLRYLHCFTWPSHMSLIWNLQTLVITRGLLGRTVVPIEIWKMPQLRHLECNEIYLPSPPSGDDYFCLRNLQTLKRVVDFKWSDEACKRIPNIKKLHLELWEGQDDSGLYYNLSNLGCLYKLESLRIELFYDALQYRSRARIPLMLPSSLNKLSLRNWHLHWEDLRMIASLPQLEVLNLEQNYATECEWIPVNAVFHRLKFLKLQRCHLRSWTTTDDSHFPVLEKLVLQSMDELDEIPWSIGDTPTLQLIRLEYCTESAVVSALSIKEEQESLGNEGLQLQIVRNSRDCRSASCVSSEPKQKVCDPITVEGVPRKLSSFPPDAVSIASTIKYHAEFTPLFSSENFEPLSAFFATAQSVRDALITNWNATYNLYERKNVKQAYYLSMEFLQGRALLNAIGNLELTGEYAAALEKLGHTLETVASQEPDAALGNGGLGRLASCFLDSLATLNYPAWGYGLRYKYGLFKQLITKDGQEEVAENWLEIDNPWEIVRNDVSYPVKFYGKVVTHSDGKRSWIGGEDIAAVAYDVPIPGYKTKTTINLRLWSTKVPSDQLDLCAFNAGEHTKACEAQANAEKICYILYPGDESEEGKILRLKQQYTLCSASLQDIIARFERRSGANVRWEELPDKVAVQMNDTHPTLCIPELIRILMDLKGMSWEEAWRITQRTVAYTNHTVLPEALEKWSYDLMQRLLPRHVDIIEMIDEQLIGDIIAEYGTSNSEILEKKLAAMRILENFDLPSSIAELFAKSKEKPMVKTGEEVEDSEEATITDEDEPEGKSTQKKSAAINKEPAPIPPKMVRMANLCVVGGHAVNGVAEIHSEIVKEEVFNDFFQLWPEKFQNKTNGVTPRRWIKFCNPGLSAVITKWIGTDHWVLKTEKLAELRKFADNEDLQNEWRAAKRSNKIKVASFLKQKTGYSVNPDAMFDIQIKRIHEYKRQLLNILGIVYRYKKMKEMTAAERKAKFVPRVCIFGGKAFSTYVQAKRIVKFITDVGATINHDPDIGDLLKVVFVPDYNVSAAELLIPASELSQHISGTSNMKFAMDGCVLIGTLDGANVEIRQEVGEDNFFLFGAQAHEIAGLRKERAAGEFVPDERFEEVKKFVRSGAFGPNNYDELMRSLEGNEGFGRGDYFLVGKDFPSYIECQEKVDDAYRDQRRWTKMSILNTAGSYKFSSDRTIHEYAKDIWGIEPLEII